MNVIAMIGLLFLIPESPKYLLSKGFNEEACNVLKYIARINGSDES